MQFTTIIAFDQHAATTVAAVLLPNHRTPVLHSLTSDTATIVRFVERLRRQGAVRCCYEAGPCGFELQRALVPIALHGKEDHSGIGDRLTISRAQHRDLDGGGCRRRSVFAAAMLSRLTEVMTRLAEPAEAPMRASPPGTCANSPRESTV